MAEHAGDGLDPRVERFLSRELARAEADLQRSPIRPRSRTPLRIQPLSLVAGLALAVALLGALIVLRPSGVGGGPTLGPDGIPLSIDGEPVLRADEIAARLSTPDMDGSAFLAGGFLVVDLQRCRAPEPSTGEVDCGQAWFMRDDLADPPGSGFPIMTGAESPGFVRTSGAATVAWVRPAGHVTFCGPSCPNSLFIESTAWRQPTKGPVPANASPPEGGMTNLALVPDFVEYVGRTGETVIGYIAKDDLFLSGRTIPGSPADPPQAPPLRVYGEDLVTVIGHDVPGVGFVAAGESMPPAPSEPVGDPSQGPSATPGVAYEDGVPSSIDGEPVLAGSDIGPAMAVVGRSFLVTGLVGVVVYDCEVGGCPGGGWVLQDPRDEDRGDPGVFLLSLEGVWSPPSDDRWPGDQVVLRVRRYDQPCPWSSFCDAALLVEDWIPAP